MAAWPVLAPRWTFKGAGHDLWLGAVIRTQTGPSVDVKTRCSPLNSAFDMDIHGRLHKMMDRDMNLRWKAMLIESYKSYI